MVQTIEKYSELGIFIEMLADGYKFPDIGICWRGQVTWNENGQWLTDDVGCHKDYGKILDLCADVAEQILVERKQKTTC